MATEARARATLAATATAWIKQASTELTHMHNVSCGMLHFLTIEVSHSLMYDTGQAGYDGDAGFAYPGSNIQNGGAAHY